MRYKKKKNWKQCVKTRDGKKSPYIQAEKGAVEEDGPSAADTFGALFFFPLIFPILSHNSLLLYIDLSTLSALSAFFPHLIFSRPFSFSLALGRHVLATKKCDREKKKRGAGKYREFERAQRKIEHNWVHLHVEEHNSL